MDLGTQAAVEEDPQKLMSLVSEILELLEEKERRLGIIPEKPEANTRNTGFSAYPNLSSCARLSLSH